MDKITISKDLLKLIIGLTGLEVTATHESVDYYITDKGHYGSAKLTAQQGIEPLQIKEELKGNNHE